VLRSLLGAETFQGQTLLVIARLENSLRLSLIVITNDPLAVEVRGRILRSRVHRFRYSQSLLDFLINDSWLLLFILLQIGLDSEILQVLSE
jgi:hypothetical protein